MYGGGLLPRHGSDAQKETWLPELANGDADWAIGVTEPDAGLNTINIQTTAERDSDGYVLNEQKVWPTGIDTADRVVLLARTMPKSEAGSRGEGLTIFLVDPDEDGANYKEIPKDIYHHPSFSVFVNDVRVPETTVLGEEHRGLYHFFSALNLKRIYIAASLYGIGNYVLGRAVDYVNERIVLEEPIGSHQAIQYPLADAYAGLELAKLMMYKPAWMDDASEENVGEQANIANLKASEVAWAACEQAITTFGGSSVRSDIGIAKSWEEVRHQRIAPVSE